MKIFLQSFILIILVFVYAGCSKSDKECWDDAVKFQKEGKTNEAIAAYEQLYQNHPKSPIAPKALFEIGKIYQNGSVRNMNPMDYMKKAAEYYGKISTEYPDCDEAPKVLFMKGFIESNELHDYAAAKNTYQKFIEKYPNNELVPSAKMEIQTMGTPAEEIIEKDLKAQSKAKK